MIGSRFFAKSREIFGTPLLQMGSSNIKRLCKSSKFHVSTRVNVRKTEQLNNAFDNMTQTLRCSDAFKIAELSENETATRSIAEELQRLGFTELVNRAVTGLTMQDLKAIEVRLCGSRTLSALVGEARG